MSLTRKRRMTEKRLAAIRQNQKHSQGPVTPEGRQRVRQAHLKHGFYSKSDAAALRALGEDPARVEALLAGLEDHSTTLDTLQKVLVQHLARLSCRLDRVARTQEGNALRRAQQEFFRRNGRLHLQMMRLKLTSSHWDLLARSVARPNYVTMKCDLDLIKELHKDKIAPEMSEVALGLFYELQEPGTLRPGDPGFEDDEQQAQQRLVLRRIKEIFGLADEPEKTVPGGPTQATRHWGGTPSSEASSGSPAAEAPEPGTAQPAGPPADCSSDAVAAEPDAATDEPDSAIDEPDSAIDESDDPRFNPLTEFSLAYPDITEKQWETREPVRQLLENLLRRQVEIFESQHHDYMRQLVAGPSPNELAADLMNDYPGAEFLLKIENSNFRHATRIGSLLLRLRRQELLAEERDANDPCE